jgi:uncharacterized DUF497 family protein
MWTGGLYANLLEERHPTSEFFDWDDAIIAHIAEHEILPTEAEEVVSNKPVDVGYQNRNGEERLMQIGETLAGRVLIVVTTPRNGLLRVVTAFPASRAYRAFYASRTETQNGEEGSA